MTEVVDVFDILRPVLTEDSSAVHLAPLNWAERSDIASLCGRAIRRARPATTFARSGCLACARRAIGAGVLAFRETPRVVVNLSRFIDDRSLQTTRGGELFEKRGR